MPPFLPRKRLRSPSPTLESSQTRGKGREVVLPGQRKPTLFDALDTHTNSGQSAEQTRDLLAKLVGSDDGQSDLSSLSSSEPEFEDVPKPKRRRVQQSAASDDDDEESVEFEDVHTNETYVLAAPPPSGDLELTLTKETRISLVNPHNKKQGPSKIERQIRVSTHCMHVQYLLWHNWLRNQWICDAETQQILLKQLGPNVQKEIQRWRDDSGVATTDPSKETAKKKEKKKAKAVNERNQRDWGEPAQRLATGGINLSHGDPLFTLMRALSAYWKKRFRITAPGLRKIGYMSLPVLDEELKSFNKDPHDPELHGERIQSIEEFRACAKVCEGSRDVSSQLFTSLLRAIGLEARMVVSLQPVGFGWSKNEEAAERRRKSPADKGQDHQGSDFNSAGQEVQPQKTPQEPNDVTKHTAKERSNTRMNKAASHILRRNKFKDTPIDISDSEAATTYLTSDTESVIDVTPIAYHVGTSKSYEKDLPPNYWTEVLSSVSQTYYAINPFNIKNPVATNPELLAAFEPRGSRSEKAKQVMAYIVGFSPDGTAKDVTVRYLKRHMWPGKTKGFRIPVEKVPVYDQRGKIGLYEESDWFRTVLRSYMRGSDSRTEIDDREEATDLKPVKPEKKEVKDGEETLQSYKSSSEFILERHLRREEALLPKATHVKLFTVKGKKGEPSIDEKVFLRRDVVSCKSVETWHKEGREPIMGEQPLKRVPYRAATTNRKRELAEAEAASGEKMLQGLYSWRQTDWIIPPPIVDGVIPKNAYGNMDVYVPSMVPRGAVHLPRRRTKEICRKLGLDYAEAVTGFEFGARMAVPIITGVVVAEEHAEMVLEQWRRDEAERARREDEKRTKAALGMWRKFLMGLRIVARVREEYGGEAEDDVDMLNPWINKNSRQRGDDHERGEAETRRSIIQDNDDMAGGFFPEGQTEEEPAPSFFPIRHEVEDYDGGPFVVEDEESATQNHGGATSYATPISLLSNTRSQMREVEDGDEEYDMQSTFAQKPKPATSSSSVRNAAKVRRGKPGGNRGTTSGRREKFKKGTTLDHDAEPEPENQLGDEEVPTLSSPPDPTVSQGASEPHSESKAIKPKRNSRTRQMAHTKPTSHSTRSPRAVPKRAAARKSETALRSHYFVDGNGENEDEE